MEEEKTSITEDIIIWRPGIIRTFKFTPYDPKLEQNILGFYNNHEVDQCYRLHKKEISAETHGYYRGYILPKAANCEKFRGWKFVNIHKYFVQEFLQDVVEEQMNGERILIITTLSTSNCGSRRMNRFINDVRQFLEENGIKTNDPQKNRNEQPGTNTEENQ